METHAVKARLKQKLGTGVGHNDGVIPHNSRRQPMSISPLAGQPAESASLIDPARLIADYYAIHPDPGVGAQRVSFGTSGHRGSASDGSFNERHILAITQAICAYRAQARIAGP